MERGNKKVLKELSLPLRSSPIGKRTDESKYTAKTEGDHKDHKQLVP